MFKKKTTTFILSMLMVPFFLKAETYSLNKNFYIGFSLGALVPNDVKVQKSGAGVINGVNFSANIAGNFVFDNGYQVGGILGYRLNDFFSFETDLAYTNFDYDKLELTVAGTATVGGNTFTGTDNTTYDVDGSISSFSIIFGPAFDMDVRENLEFFIGGGIGFASYSDEIKTVGGSSGLAFDEDFTDFAAKFKAGFNYSLSDLSYLQAEYGYNFVDSGIENYSDDFSANSFSAKIIFNF